MSCVGILNQTDTHRPCANPFLVEPSPAVHQSEAVFNGTMTVGGGPSLDDLSTLLIAAREPLEPGERPSAEIRLLILDVAGIVVQEGAIRLKVVGSPAGNIPIVEGSGIFEEAGFGSIVTEPGVYVLNLPNILSMAAPFLASDSSIRVETEAHGPNDGNCDADVDDGSGTGRGDGGVTLDDLLYYMSIFDAGSEHADMDDGTGDGVPDGGVGIDDLLYYLQRFDQGC